ncbi:MAG: class I SAM-dependent rRNA methyltransferase [Anaerolineae bacterium]|nr:class I SAM-dependent rRNA methyltransferase [Anaerolineae bacterium]
MIDFDSLPQPSERRIAVHVQPAAERALRSGHPWLFDQAIRKQSHDGQPGDLAVIFDQKRRFLAVGLYDPDSPIRVRILQHWQQAAINADWFAERLRAAAAIRQPLIDQQTTGYRLVHGENDGLPGLIIDRYADTLVLKLYTAAWLPHLRDVIAGLQAIQPFDALILRLSRNMEAATLPLGLQDGQTLIGEAPEESVIFQENGLRFAADAAHGHKTGFFFDQRDNRAFVRKITSGRRVLDVFAYSGGFSVYAASGGATDVTSLDSSAPALAAAAANFALNQADTLVAAARHLTLAEDAFDGLERLYADGQRYDLVIVDPPAFAKNAAEVERALAAYTRLTGLALNVLAERGILVMASCSSRVTPDAFFSTVLRATSAAGRPCIEIKRSGHALDHPIGFPEGEYLKCLFAAVTD